MKLQIDLSSEEFDDKYDEKKPYLKRQALKEIFTLEEFEKILYVANPGAPYFKIRLQDEVDKKQYVEQVHRFGKVVNRINRYRFNSLMDRGATPIINEIEVHSLAIKKMCNQLSSLTGQEVKANAYYTLGENSTFGFHWDPHDVFSIQLIGSKKWTLYEPTVLNPIAMMTRADTGPDKSKNCVQISMEPGDMLYVPRGWWHNVEGSGVPTLHIAFGVQILHYANYIAWACKWLLREHEQCRKKIKLHRVDCEDLISAAQIAYKEISRPQNLKFFLEKVVDNYRFDESFGIGSCQKPWGKPHVKISLATSYHQAFAFHGMSCLNGSDVYQGDDVNKLVEILKKESEVSLDELARLSMLSVVQLEDALITLNKSEHVVFS